MERSFCWAAVGIFCVFSLGCGSDADQPETPIVVETPASVAEPPTDPMSILPEDISLWEAFDPKRILKHPDTNTLVVEGVVAGDAAALASELEAASEKSGWSTDTLTTHGGLTTLIMRKDSRQLKVNITQDGVNVNVYLTTRLPK